MNLGEQLPVFSLLNQNGQLIDSKAWLGAPVVIFFYPKDNTPGCTAEVCAFRDEFSNFRGLNAQVVGISSDSVESHLDFVQKYKLPFDLLADTEQKVRKLFGVKGNLFGLIPGRATYVFDAAGKLTHFFQSQLQARQHIEEALKQLAN